jgi:SOS-response transcriptional repressor LexA
MDPMNDAMLVDDLLRLVGDELNHDLDSPFYSDARFLEWYSADLIRGMSTRERESLEFRTAEFAQRVSRKIRARKLAERLRTTLGHSRLPEIVRFASEEFAGSAPLLELPVAAGRGRELWDEEPEAWIQVPKELPDARYVALRVAGDSMIPLLEQRDVILLQLDAFPKEGDLTVAYRPGEGYVVKCVAKILAREVELESLNPEYEDFRVPKDSRHILGTVVARFLMD